MKTRQILGALAAGALLLTACGSDPATPGNEETTPAASQSGELTVWLMDGSQPDSVVESVKAQFAETYPDVDVTVELQEWAGVQDKLTTAMNSDATPDVVEIGNSLTAKFADAGLLSDLTDQADDLGQANWLAGLAASGELDGQRFGIPYYGGVRIVMYNKDHFAEAGVEIPTTLDELEDVASKLAEANGGTDAGYSAFYFPGKFWYGALPFIWAEGGEIATLEGDEWVSGLDSDGARAGLERLKGLVDTYSTAPTDGDEVSNWEVFQEDNVGMVMDSWWAPGAVAGVEGWADKVGAFPLPGVTADETAPAFMGGSDLAVPERSDAKEWATEWIRILTSEEIQTQLASEGGVIPNNEASFSGHEGNDFLLAADEAARVSAFTPVSPQWGNVEGEAVLPDMLVKILSGSSSIEDATTEAAQRVNDILNG